MNLSYEFCAAAAAGSRMMTANRELSLASATTKTKKNNKNFSRIFKFIAKFLQYKF